MIPETTWTWVFWVFLLISFACSAAGYWSEETGWYVVAVLMAVGAIAAALVMATVDPTTVTS